MGRDSLKNSKQLLTVKEVASWLSISASLVYQLVDMGKLPVHRIGSGRGAIRFLHEDIENYLSASRSEALEPKRSEPRVKLKHIRLN